MDSGAILDPKSPEILKLVGCATVLQKNVNSEMLKNLKNFEHQHDDINGKKTPPCRVKGSLEKIPCKIIFRARGYGMQEAEMNFVFRLVSRRQRISSCIW